MLRKQSGVALIVALIITIIIGIIAISTAGLAYRGQRSQNMTYSNVVSTSNAYSAATKAFKFIAALSPVGKGKVLEPTDFNSPPNYDSPGVWTINSKDIRGESISTYYKGVDEQLDKSFGTLDSLTWYRYNVKTDNRPSSWDDCGKCVFPRYKNDADKGALAYRIEKRDFKKVNPGSDEEIGYWYYRITAKGEDDTCTKCDPKDDQCKADVLCPQTVVQTNVAVIGVK